MVLTKDIKPTGGAASDLLQILQPNGPELAAEAKALAAALLLREAADAVISGVVDPNPAVLRHRKAMLIGEAGVAHVVLRAGR
jgi:hypothetical protein